ncbi:hypothetical protein ONZ51_g4133 [Trametes cubensis]|uniref:Uncharacterized protein n=1 Tax=Trametes cubensis TaxID=1111947 RepID=A0AAD7TWG7_9APHY|nr:hypothetical protein ONZ51_g4133 [Trametes cubensis]
MLSHTPKSAVWKKLADARLFAALCAIHFRVSFMAGSSVKLTERQKKAHMKALPSPWYEPLAIICTAALQGPMRPTKTERTMIEEIKEQWSAVMQRIWSEPGKSLDNDPSAVFERAIVAQIVMKLSTLNPSFLQVIFKPEDLTLAVCFRFWAHAIVQEDLVLNNTLFLTLLKPELASPWKRYLATHPPPASQVILSRMLLGASEEVGAQEQRTPSQTAEIVVDAFANHLAIDRMPLAIVGQEVELFMAIWTLAETEFPEFPRAVCKADRFWAAIPPIVRRSLLSRQHEDRAVGVNALRLYLQTMYYTNEAEAELADAIIYGWVTGGLFDMLDEMMEAILVQVEGPMAIALIMTTITSAYPKLSAKTRTALRAQLPRTGAVWRIVKFGLLRGVNSNERQCLRDYASFSSGRAIQNPYNPLWHQGAWETLASLGWKVRGSRFCSRRGCKRAATGPMCATGRCKRTRYCSHWCLQRDKEHIEMCSKNWFMIIEHSTRGEDVDTVDVAALGTSMSWFSWLLLTVLSFIARLMGFGI